MQLHLVQRRRDPRIAEHQSELRDGHVGDAEVADQAGVDQLLESAEYMAMYSAWM